ncbi:F-box/kelch-repeat protein At3g06240-like [Salvia hispanica]|uniref:F-box/kelch-repeat protein At3g06240-like n=1 Tax=Salvia hispanica TaxID=49212 RepID=UPI0020090F54|nr:F-box/kelch-repeat protein At3g06240-like [Salvia hispanica]
MDSNLLNHDVVTEILSHCPFTSVLRFRSVCKSWRDHIDSEAFRKSHILHHADDDRDGETLLMQFSFRKHGVPELSVFTGKLHSNSLPPSQEISDYLAADSTCHAQIAGPANGVICVYYRASGSPVAVCNPSLGLIAILPMPPNPSSKSLEPNHHKALFRDFGIWFDEVAQDYMVVQLLSCHINGLYLIGSHLHASVYSRATNSWRELSIIDLGLCEFSPINSRCKNSAFAHWLAKDNDRIELILSFDFRSEGFRVLEIPDLEASKMYRDRKIFAEGGDSFLVFFSGDGKGPDWLNIFWLWIEGSMLQWNHMKRVGVGPFDGLVIPKALCERGYVVLQSKNNGYLLIYNYCDEKYVRCFEMNRDVPEIFEYRGNFVLP